jgi:diacylglycerol kinase (ATP)
VTEIALLINPTAGRGRAAKLVESVSAALRRRGATVTPLVGRNADEARSLARRAVHDGVDAVVALGGDGMAHLALNVVAATPTPLGIVPAGTGNDLAAALELPTKDPVAAAALIADRLAAGETRRMDAGRAGDKWFGCVLSAGFDSRVNDRANRMTWPRGRMRYNLAILAELRVFKPVPFALELDGDVWETEAMLVAVGNARSYGAGMLICPGAQLDDGILDITVLGPVSKPEFLKAFPKVFKGTHTDHPAVTCRQAKSVTIRAEGISIYADGEPFAEPPVRCDVVPGAVQVLA